MAMTIGGPHATAIAGAAGIAGVAISQLINHWGELSSALQSAWEGGSADRLKVLAERAETAAAAFEKLAKAPTQFEEKGAKILEQAIKDTPAERLRGQIADALQAGGHIPIQRLPQATGEITDFGSPTEQELMNKMIAGGKTPAEAGLAIMAEEQRRTRLKAEEEAKNLAGGLGAPGAAGQAARDMMKRLIIEAPGAFSEEFKKKFAESDPAFIKKREEEEKAAKLGQKQREEDQKHHKEMGAVKKKDEEELRKKITERIQNEKQGRIQSLEDERTAIQRKQRDFDNQMWERMHENTAAQVIGGGLAGSHYFQQYTGGDDPKQLAKEAHKQREKTNEKLQQIEDALKKERRLVVPH